MKKLYLLFTLCLTLLGLTKANAETTLVSSNPELGKIPATTESITLTFSNEIQDVPMVVLQSSMAQLPEMKLWENYSYWGNELTINLPLENTVKVQDLTVIATVIDVDGKPVTAHNHSFYPEQPGMLFLEYTLEPVEPTIVEFSPELGAIDATEKSIYLTFSTPIAEVEVLQLQSSNGELPALEADKDYFFWGNGLSIVLPLEYTAKMPDLLLTLKVKDIQGKYVTYSNSEQHQGVPDMVYLYYTLNPVTPTVEDAGAVDNTVTTATTSVDITFSTPIAKVSDIQVYAWWGEAALLQEGTDFSFYDNILTVNLPTQLLENAALVPADYRAIILGFTVEDVQGKSVVYSNSIMYGQEAAEQMQMTYLEYKVALVTKVVSIDPECGFYEVLPSVVTLTFDNNIQTVDYGTIQTQLTPFRGYMISENDYVIDGNKLTIKVPEEYLVDQSQLQIRMNVLDVNGQYVTYAYDPDYAWEGAVILEYTAPVKADLFNMVSSDPAEGAVEKLDVINVSFTDPYGLAVGGFDETKEVVVLNAEGEVVAKASMEVVFEEEDEYGWAPATNVAKFTLDTPVTETGIYTFVIPAATVYNEMYYPESEDFGVEWGALYNPEIRITYTVVATDGINGVTVDGKAEIYSLDGRKVTNPTKGIYLINGKKVVVK